MDWINKLGKFADQHVKEIGYIKYAVGIVGVGLILKNTHVTRKICTVRDVPPRFIQKHTRLQGIVKQVAPSGVLHVDHIPIMTSRLFSKNKEGLLPVSIGGVDVHESGVDYLKTNVLEKHVWFRLMNIRHSSSVECIVSHRKGMFSTLRLNEYLIEQGLGTVQHVDDLVQSNLHKRLVDRLLQAELKAEKKGRGIWTRPKLKERMKTYSTEKISDVKANINDNLNVLKLKIPFYERFSKYRSKSKMKVTNHRN